jgi:phage terminase large subunit-like protein
MSGPSKKKVESIPGEWRFPCPDWEARLMRGDIPTSIDHIKDRLNSVRVERAMNIFTRLRLSDVPNQPLLGEACGEWFLQILAVMAGALGSDGVMNIRDLLVEVPKKNAKTSFSGLALLTLMLMSPRPRAEFMVLGPTKEIADLSFSQIAGSVYCDPVLRERLHVKEHTKTILDRKSGCKLSVKAFSMDAATGTRPSGVLLDEVWLLRHPDAARVVGQLRGAQAAIDEGFVWQISTAADGVPAGYWASEITKARRIRDGMSEVQGYLPVLYEPPSKYRGSIEKVSDPKLWAMVNPNLGRSVNMDWLKTSFREAVETGEEETRRWLSQHANVEVSAYTSSGDNWGGADVWDDAIDPSLTLESMCRDVAQIVVGLDGGGADDLLSLQVLGIYEDQSWAAWSVNWVWPIALERRKSIAAQLMDFEKQGDLRVMEPGDDLEDVVNLVLQLAETGKLMGLGFDPAGIAAELGRKISDADNTLKPKLISVPQGFRLRAGYTAAERRLRQGTLRHAGQPIMSWAVKNTRLDPVSSLVTKKASGISKIDPVVSLATAVMVALEVPEALPNDIGYWIA